MTDSAVSDHLIQSQVAELLQPRVNMSKRNSTKGIRLQYGNEADENNPPNDGRKKPDDNEAKQNLLSNDAVMNKADSENILVWVDYFMSLCLLSASRSKDPHTKVGACIVKKDTHKIVGMGYNGMPMGIDDSDLPWNRTSPSGNALETKYPYVCHAEMNAIMNMPTTDGTGCILYTTKFPCNECAKLIIQSGIKVVCYARETNTDKVENAVAVEASTRLLTLAGVLIWKYEPTAKKVTMDLEKVSIAIA